MTQGPLDRISTSTYYDPDTQSHTTIDLSVVAAIVKRLKLDDNQRIILTASLHDLKPKSIGASTKGLFPSGDQVLKHIANIERLAEMIAKLELDKDLHFHAVSSAFQFRDSDIASSSPLQEDDMWVWLAQAKNIASICNEARQQSGEIISFQEHLAGPYVGQEQLIGCYLPRLFEKITGKTFGISKSDNKPNATGGVLFVMDCVQALGLEAVTPNNVERHRKAANRKSKGVLGT